MAKGEFRGSEVVYGIGKEFGRRVNLREDKAKSAERLTLAAEIEVSGVGVHSGLVSLVRLRPAPFSSGWQIGPLGDVDRAVKVGLGCAEAVPGACRLVGATWTISTIEHLFAALYGAGITDVFIEFSGTEVPILDGSALPWSERIEAAGISVGPALQPLLVSAPVRVRHGDSWASLSPDSCCRVEVSVAFEAAPWVNGAASVVLSPGAFVSEVAWARTFVLAEQVSQLRESGRGVGATEENTVLVGPLGPLSALRGPDEVVRHKLLDAVGDLSLLGRPLLGRLEVHRGSHALHLALLREAAARHRWS